MMQWYKKKKKIDDKDQTQKKIKMQLHSNIEETTLHCQPYKQ